MSSSTVFTNFSRSRVSFIFAQSVNMEESPVPPMQCMRDNFIQGDLFGQWNRWHIDYQVNGLNQFLDVIRDLVIRYGCYCGQPDCLHTPDDPKGKMSIGFLLLLPHLHQSKTIISFTHF